MRRAMRSRIQIIMKSAAGEFFSPTVIVGAAAAAVAVVVDGGFHFSFTFFILKPK